MEIKKVGQKEVPKKAKKYVLFSEDFENYIYEVRPQIDFLDGSLFDEEIQRGVTARIGTLTDLPEMKDSLQAVFFSKSHFTLEQAENWWKKVGDLLVGEVPDILKETPVDLNPNFDLPPFFQFKKDFDKKYAADLRRIEGVEIFSAGTWNGDEYSVDDLDLMVEAFTDDAHKIVPHLKLGHNDEQELLAKDGLPAAGWVANLRRDGEKLLADFIDIPKKIFELIENGAYRKVSSEIFWNANFGGKVFKRMLSAVSLLGADTPAVSSLDDILALYKNLEYDSIREYSFNNNEETEKMEKELKDRIENLEAESKQYKNDLEARDKAIADKDAELEAAQKKLNAFEQKVVEQELKGYAQELIKEELATKSMDELVQFLVSDKKSYTKDKTEFNKQDALKECLKLFKASLVNLEEGSEEGKKADSEDELKAKIEQYAKENKVSFSEAYRIVGN